MRTSRIVITQPDIGITWPKHRMLELSPLTWNATQQLTEVRAPLAANPYRV